MENDIKFVFISANFEQKKFFLRKNGENQNLGLFLVQNYENAIFVMQMTYDNEIYFFMHLPIYLLLIN